MNLIVKRKKHVKTQTLILGVKIKTSKNVYEPHEDSEMLAKAVKENAFGDFLDVGTGSGLQAIIAGKNNKVKTVTAVDLDEKILKEAEKNAKNKGVRIKFIKSNLFSNLSGKFDCIAFNPPYLPTAKKEKLSGLINSAFDGGLNGRKTTNEFIKHLKPHLKPRGVAFIVGSSLSNYAKTVKELKTLGFETRIIDRKNFFIEELVIIKAWLH
jgi:release factor glutamine methyltransferase